MSGCSTVTIIDKNHPDFEKIAKKNYTHSSST